MIKYKKMERSKYSKFMDKNNIKKPKKNFFDNEWCDGK